MKFYLILFSVLSVILSGCSERTEAKISPASGTVAVAVHGVNYTDESFRYVLIDPENPSNRAGGEHVEPFSGGGIMCCYKLPKQWAPGNKVKVSSTHWLAKDSNGDIPEIRKEYTISIPQYPNENVPELWVLRTSDGHIEVVASHVDPDHPEWPGSKKGWPEPSLTYQRMKWAQQRDQTQHSIDTFKKLLHRLENEPERATQKAWQFAVEHGGDDIEKFKGASDPAFKEYLRKSYAEDLRETEDVMDQLLREKP